MIAHDKRPPHACGNEPPVGQWWTERNIMEQQQTITSIRVVEREADLRGFVNPDDDLTPKQVQQAINTYCETYAAIIRETFPGVEVEVETGETNGYTYVYVNEVRFDDGPNRDDRGEFGGAPAEVFYLAERIIDRWPSTMNKKLTILVTADQRQRYHIAAATAGVTLSDVVRAHLDEWAAGILAHDVGSQLT